MKKVAVVTATRAEYGLLSPVIRELRKLEDDDFRTELIVTGTHLDASYGMTVDQISERIDHRISISVKSDSELDISGNQAEALRTEGVEIEWYLLKGKGTLLLADEGELPIATGDVVRFEDGDVHGLRNDGNAELIYLSVTAPPIDFGYAYRSTS